MYGLAALAAVTVQLSDARPTGTVVLDRLWCAAFGIALVFLASRSTRNAWLWMTGAATAGAIGSAPALAIAAVGLALAVVAVFQPTRARLVGAGIGLASATALLTLPDLGPHGASSLVAVVAIVPVVRSGYANSSERQRARMRRGSAWALAVVVVSGLVAGVGTGLAAVNLAGGVRDAEAGLSAVGNGDQDLAAVRFAASEQSFDSADTVMSGPWMWPARVVPVLAQHVDAVGTATGSGRRLTASAGEAAVVAPYQDLKADDGRLDVARIADMQGPVHDARQALERAADDLDGATSPWLVGPLTGALDRFRGEVDDALPQARLADDALQVAPGLLGAEGDRRYLVLFTTPAESRNLGGFAGSYAVLEAVGGDVDLAESGGIDELNQGAPRTIEDQDEFVARYGRYRVERYIQNVTVSPDMGTVAEVSASLYAQATGDEVDGVLVADPFALAALLELTGPIDVPSVGFPLDATNVIPYLLKDQYVLYDEQEEVRRDRLEAVGRATFDALTDRPLPGPSAIGSALGPAVDEKRLFFYPFGDEARDLMRDLDVSGELAAPAGSDLLSVRMSNLRANKIDAYVQKDVGYDVTYDPTTGAVQGTVRVTVRNEAPPAGLPDYVIGSPTSIYPQGTARLMMGLFTPLSARSVALDGAPVGVEAQTERGLEVYSVPIEVPAGGEVTLEYEIEGTVEGMGDTYRLLASSQPLANPDALAVTVRAAEGAPGIDDASGVEVADGIGTRNGTWVTDERVRVTFG